MALRPGRCLLAYHLKRNKMTQVEFAERMGVTQSMVSQIATNYRIMSLEFAVNAALILKCNIEDLYTWEKII